MVMPLTSGKLFDLQKRIASRPPLKINYKPRFLTADEALKQHGIKVDASHILKVSETYVDRRKRRLDFSEIVPDESNVDTYWEYLYDPSSGKATGIKQLDRSYRETGVQHTLEELGQQRVEFEKQREDRTANLLNLEKEGYYDPTTNRYFVSRGVANKAITPEAADVLFGSGWREKLTTPEQHGLMSRLFPDLLSRIPDENDAFYTVREWASAAPELFIEDLRKRQASSEDVRSLMLAMDATDQDAQAMADWYGRIPNEREDEIFASVFPGLDKDQVVKTATEDFDSFLQHVQSKGRNQNTEDLLRFLGYSEKDIDRVFPMPSEVPGEGFAKPLAVTEVPLGTPVTLGGKGWPGEVLPGVEGQPVYPKEIVSGKGRGIPQVSEQVTMPQPMPNRPTSLVGKAVSSFTAGMGDVLSTGAGALSWLGDDRTAQVLRDMGTGLQAKAPPDTTGQFDVADLLNPDYYATKIVRALPFSLSLAPVALVGGAGGAIIAGAFGLGTIGTMLITGGLGALLSRPLESAMEAGNQYDDAIARGKTAAEAKKQADEVFRKNMTLAGADAWEIGIALAPTPKWVPATLVKRGLVKTAQVGGKMIIVGLSEGGEEIYQDIIQRHAQGEKWELDPVSKEAFAIGAVMGLGMGFGGDVVSGVVAKAKEQLSPDLQTVFRQSVDAGKTELQALNDVASTPEGKIRLQKIIDEIKAAREGQAPATLAEVQAGAKAELTPKPELPITPKPSPKPVQPPAEGLQTVKGAEIPAKVEVPTPTPVTKGVEVPGEVPPTPPAKPPTAVVPEETVLPGPEPKPTYVQKVREAYKTKLADLKGILQDKVASLKDWKTYSVEQQNNILRATMEEKLTTLKGQTEDKIASLMDWARQSVKEEKAIGQGKLADLTGVLEDRTASLKDWASYSLAEQDRVKNILTDYIQEQLPLAERGKLLDAVKNIKKQEELDGVIKRVDAIAETSAQKTLRTQIEKQLSVSAAKETKGMPKGKYTVEVQRQLDVLKHYLLDNNKAVLKTLSSEDLGKALARIIELRGEGRIAHVEKELLRQAEMENFRTNVIKDVTGGKGLKTGGETVSTKSLEQDTGIYARITHPNIAWDTTLNSLDKLSGAAPHQGSNSWLGRLATRANEAENIGRSKQLDTVRENFSRIFGVTKPKDINNQLRKLSEKVDLGRFKNSDGVEVSFNGYSKGQIIKKYQEMQDPTLEKAFNEGMKWTPEIWQAFNNALTTQEKVWADYQMQFLQDYHPSINEVFSSINNVDLPKNEFYTPIVREMEPEVEYNLLDPNDMMKYAGVAPGSLKSRVTNIHPLKFTDANQTLIKHILEMEHYKAWAEPMRTLRSVYGDADVRSAIAQYHGKDMREIIDGFLNDFARGGIDQGHTVKILDTLRTNFATAVIGLKPNIALQQVPTVLGYLAEMSPKDFTVGVADFWKHPVENFKWMMENSPYIKARYEQGFERDIKAALASDTFRQFTGKANVRDGAFFLMTTGDKSGVLQGWWAVYKRGLKQGLSQAEAMEEAGLATDRTQNTSSIDTLSSLQRGGSFWKLLTMFQNQPNKYFRIIFENVENLKYGRGNKADAIKAIVIAWVVLPAIFQFVTDGFQLKKEHQARAVVLGPLNDLLVIGQIVQWLSGRMFGENFDYNATPILGGLNDVGKAIQNGITLGAKRLDPYKDIVWDDVIGFTESVTKAGGEIFGAPTPWLIQAEKALRGTEGKRDLRQLIMSQWALEPPAPSLKDKATLAVTGDEDNPGLGSVIPPKPGKEKAGEPEAKPAPVKTMAKLNTEYKEMFNKTLPQDIGKDFDPLAQLWAKKEISLANSNVLPNVPLFQINTDPTKSPYYTIDDYVKQWQTRQQITSLQKLKEYDDKNGYPQAFLGNVNRTQLDLLHKWALIPPTDKAGQNAFKVENPGITADLRMNYLKDHPDENALQAIFGDAEIYSSAAYDKVQTLAKEYDIPVSAFPEFKNIPTDSDTRKAFFDYQETVDKFGSDTPEAHLMLLKDDKLHKFLSPGWEKKTEIPAWDDKPIPALEIDVKNRKLNDERKVLLNDKAQQAWDVKNPDWVKDQIRIDAYIQQYKFDSTVADKKIVEAWADFKSKGYTATSLEGQLARVDNPELSKWGETVGPTGEAWKPLSIKSVDALRLQVKNKAQDATFNALPTAEAKTTYLLDPKNKNYALDTFRIDAYNAGIPKDQIETYAANKLEDKYVGTLNNNQEAAYKIAHPDYALRVIKEKGTNAGVPAASMPLYTQYEQTPTEGQSRERLLQANPEYYQNVYLGILNGNPVDFTKVASEKFETTYKNEYDVLKTTEEQQYYRYLNPWFDQEGVAIGKWEPVFVKSAAARVLEIANQAMDKQYSRILEPAKKKQFLRDHPDYWMSTIKIQGYNYGVPKKYIGNYVEMMFLPTSGYALERYMVAHPDYYKDVYQGILGKKTLDTRNIPSEAVESQYNVYLSLSTKAKTAYRKSHSALNAWLKRRSSLGSFKG